MRLGRLAATSFVCFIILTGCIPRYAKYRARPKPVERVRVRPQPPPPPVEILVAEKPEPEPEPVVFEAPKPKAPGAIAVFRIDDVSRSFSPDTLEQVTEYLSAKVTELLGVPVIPQEAIRARLVAEKSKGFSDCHDQSCQIALGRALSAQKSLATKLLRVGNACAIAIAFYDLETEVAERAASTQTDCSADRLFAQVDDIVSRLDPHAPKRAPLPIVAPVLAPIFAPIVGPVAPVVGPPPVTEPIVEHVEGISILARTKINAVGTRKSKFSAEVRLAPPLSALAKTRPGLNIAFLIDTSSSMGTEKKLAFAKKAVSSAARHLRPDDKLSIIGFARAPLVLYGANAAPSGDMLVELLEALKPDGKANLLAGLEAALGELEPNIRFDRSTRLVLITDSPAEEGGMEARLVELAADQLAKAGASVTAIGVGGDFDAPLLRRIADLGTGRFHPVAAAEDLPAVLAREIQSLGVQVMGDVTIEIDPEPGAALVDRDDRRIAVGAVVAGESRSIPIALAVSCAEAGTMPVAHVAVRYRDWLDDGRVVTQSEALATECVASP